MIYLDFETRSESDIKSVGAWEYSTHPSTEIICMAHKKDDEKTRIWAPGDTLPKWLGLERRMAHNAWFEQCIWYNCAIGKYGFPMVEYDLWYCSMAWGLSYALPQSLRDIGRVLELDVEKSWDDHSLMLKMCKPKRGWNGTSHDKWHEDPEDMARLLEYCKRDVDTLHALAMRLNSVASAIGAGEFGGIEQ